jgi:transcription antitermination factor NusG
MKNKLILILGFLLSMSSCRQDIVPNELKPKFDRILENPQILTEYDFNEDTTISNLAIPFDFDSNQFRDSLILEKLENTHIKFITYVYSDYKKDDRFKQDELNRERLFDLHNYFPNLFDNEEIKWQTILQTGGKDEISASKLFHGYVFYCRPSPTAVSMKKEMQYIKEMIDTSLTFIAPLTDSTTIVTEIISDEIGFLSEGDYIVESDLSFRKDGEDYSASATGTYEFGNYFQDTVVAAVLNRNKHWNKMLIACDLTGSMSPYSAQLFIWHRLNIDKNKSQYFVFFNDGDMTPDNKKITGKTGGIYHSKAKDFDELMKVANKTMTNGYGGDAPENDIEALIAGIHKCKDCKDIILIADNWANLRDYSLIEKVNKPIRIILCGTQFGINKHYLDLARATKGSVHTIEQDIKNLMDLKEGEEVEIGKQAFKIKNGNFEEIR